MTRWNASRLLLSLIAIFTAISPYVWDWNVTHSLPNLEYRNKGLNETDPQNEAEPYATS